MPKIGLASYGDIPTGLGQLAARFVRNLGFTARLTFPHQRFPPAVPINPTKLAMFLAQVDTIVILERPMLVTLPHIAKQRRKKLVCVVMPEWLSPRAQWLRHIDRFVCFTQQGLEHCENIGLGPKTTLVPCPLDIAEFPYRERQKIESIVFCEGWGGVHERKGRKEVDQLLALDPNAVHIKSQRGGGSVAKPADLYADADAALVPGRFDGLGLTTLEAMASGAPVLATDAPPYREFVRAAYADPSPMLLPAAATNMVSVNGAPWPCTPVDVPAMLARITAARQLPEEAVRRLSQQGRRYIERVHGDSAWNQLWETILNA